MIDKLRLKNFQSHEKSEFKFARGVNVIAGRSDSGKTAAVRALRWVVFNRPSGDEFRSHWGGETQVDVLTPAGKISRLRTASKNAYYIDGEQFRAMGTAVPDEVSACAKLGPVNFQLQMDAPFLVSETAGGVARHFNVVANLDQIDTGTANVNRTEGRLRNQIESMEENEERLVAELEKYDCVEEFETRIKTLEVMENNFYVSSRLISDLSELSAELVGANGEIARFAPFVGLVEELRRLWDLRSRVDLLEKLLPKWEDMDSEIVQTLKWSELESEIDRALDLSNKIKRTETHLSHMETLDARVAEARELADEGARLLKKAMEGRCPLCGRGD